MPDLPRKSLEELVARYEMEPTLRDIYVEGTTDRDILSHFLRKSGIAGTVVYTIDSVDISAGVLLEAGDTEGQRQRVIALARLLHSVAPTCASYGIADRDLDSWFGAVEELRTLRWTKYTSIEAYFLCPEFVHDVVVSIARAPLGDEMQFYESFIDTLRGLYALRLASRELGLMLRWPPFERCLSREGSRIQLDLTDYARRVLATSGKTREGATLLEQAKSWARKLTKDVRLECRGHDIVDLLGWAIRRFGGNKDVAGQASLHGLLVALSPQHNEFAELVVS